MAFKFPTGRKGAVVQDTSGIFGDVGADPPEEPGMVQGQKARSLLEWWAAKALWKMKREFIYQYAVNGGTMRRGGMVIDFLIIDGPVIVLEMQGERWHQGQFGSGERQRESLIRAIFGVLPSYVWENQCPTEYDTYAAIRKAING